MTNAAGSGAPRTSVSCSVTVQAVGDARQLRLSRFQSQGYEAVRGSSAKHTLSLLLFTRALRNTLFAEAVRLETRGGEPPRLQFDPGIAAATQHGDPRASQARLPERRRHDAVACPSIRVQHVTRPSSTISIRVCDILRELEIEFRA